jgi:hypothetical protein
VEIVETSAELLLLQQRDLSKDTTAADHGEVIEIDMDAA